MGWELDNLYRQRKNCRNQLAETRSRIQNNVSSLSRLYPVRSRLGEYKGTAENYERTFQNLIEGLDADGNWAGNKRNDVRSCMDDYIRWDYRAYTERVDQILDAVCDEITRLENDNLSLGGSVTWLVRQINSLTNEIRKWLN